MFELILGDCLHAMEAYAGPVFDAVVTDPPAGIGMNGQEWDLDRGGREAWVRWLADRLGTARRRCRPGAWILCWSYPRRAHWTGLALEDAGWEIEDLVTHLNGQARPRAGALAPGWEGWWLGRNPGPRRDLHLEGLPVVVEPGAIARHPRNVLLDQGSQLELRLSQEGGTRKTSSHNGVRRADKHRSTYGTFKGQVRERAYVGDQGSVARYFQVLPHQLAVYAPRARFGERELAPGVESRHCTAKSPSLMRWLVSLVSAPGELVLDPFCGSGTTGQACLELGRKFFGVELSRQFLDEARLRMGVISEHEKQIGQLGSGSAPG